MRNNSGYSLASNSLNNNNNSSNSSAQQSAGATRYSNVDNTALYYCNYDNCNPIPSAPWSRSLALNQNQNHPSLQPSKRIPTKPASRLHFQPSAANSAPDSSLYADAFGQPSLINQRMIAGNNKSCEYVYHKEEEQQQQYKLLRPYVATEKEQQQLRQSMVYFDPELKKRKARPGSAARLTEYTDNSPERYRALNCPSPEPTWDTIL